MAGFQDFAIGVARVDGARLAAVGTSSIDSQYFYDVLEGFRRFWKVFIVSVTVFFVQCKIRADVLGALDESKLDKRTPRRPHAPAGLILVHE